MSIAERLRADLRSDLEASRNAGAREIAHGAAEGVLALAVLLRFFCWGLALSEIDDGPAYRLEQPRIRLTIAPVVDVPVAAERTARWAAAAGGMLLLIVVGSSDAGQWALALGYANAAWLVCDPVLGQVHRLRTDQYPIEIHESDTAEVIET